MLLRRPGTHNEMSDDDDVSIHRVRLSSGWHELREESSKDLSTDPLIVRALSTCIGVLSSSICSSSANAVKYDWRGDVMVVFSVDCGVGVPLTGLFFFLLTKSDCLVMEFNLGTICSVVYCTIRSCIKIITPTTKRGPSVRFSQKLQTPLPPNCGIEGGPSKGFHERRSTGTILTQPTTP